MKISRPTIVIEKAAEELVAAEGRNTGKPIHVTMAEEIPPMLDRVQRAANC